MPLLDSSMALLFAAAALLQINDPDPVRWVAVYGVASALSALPAMNLRAPAAVFAAAGGVALAWGGVIVVGGPDVSEYGHMFDAWEMASVGIEQAREAVGLVIAGGWMMVLAVRAARRAARTTMERR